MPPGRGLPLKTLSTRVTLRRRVTDDASGDIAAAVGGLRTKAAESLSDIEAALPVDPSVAIGKAKNLLEATAKVILGELGQPVDEKVDVRAVAVAAARALGLVWNGLPVDCDAAKIINRVAASSTTWPASAIALAMRTVLRRHRLAWTPATVAFPSARRSPGARSC